MKQCPKKSRFAYVNDEGSEDPYRNYTAYFSPNEPDYSLAPVAPRATPYTFPPQTCSINFATGTVSCLNQESNLGLYPTPFLNSMPRFQGSCPVSNTIAQTLSDTFASFTSGMNENNTCGMNNNNYYNNVPTNNFSYVIGDRIVNGPADSPLNRILTRQPVGPWKLVGSAVTNDPSNSQSRDRSMLVYAASKDTARDRYNYRIVDSNNVPLELEDNVHWKTSGEQLNIPGQSNSYTLQLYSPYGHR